ncbi:MAG: glycoside hydrolase family 13 protein [Bacteroidales bacterium]|nr:glycoside hydrolase family 13 protein [Bacteroidales bacterium]
MKRWPIVTLFALLIIQLNANPEIDRVEPPNWWVGMHQAELQILFYGKDLKGCELVSTTQGFKLLRTVFVDNPNYLFAYFSIDPSLAPGEYPLDLRKNGKVVRTLYYPVLRRNSGSAQREGFSAADNVYLLMPDRFANGDPTNDNMPGMLEKADRSNPDGRHGGDLQGIIDHLSYFKKLGMTALWLNPVLENNQPRYSYHGYAITDLYRIDARLGTNELFRTLVDSASAHGLKIIMDMVFNHLGDNHWMIRDLPSAQWIHTWPEFTRSNFRAPTIPDPYRSDADLKKMVNGWFDTHMPDLNQQEPLLADYLIQNSIWWVEYSGISGIRMDTHQYADKDFMAEWLRRIRLEYPRLSVVSECWVEQKAFHAYWFKDAFNRDGYHPNMDFITDFPLYIQLRESFNDERQGWEQGVERLYYCLAQDLVYEDPKYNMVFLDNHDLSRFWSVVREDFGNFSIGLAFLYTVRGMPQLTYGTEMLMKGYEWEGHGPMRANMPGGWKEDVANAFVSAGRNKKQQMAWELISRLANWRKGKPVIHSGKTRHFIPENNAYVYFRYNEADTVMVVLNYNKEDVTLDLSRFSELMGERKTGFDVVANRQITWNDRLTVAAKSAMILEF